MGKQNRMAVGMAVYGLVVLGTGLAQARKLSPVELTTDSIVIVEWDASSQVLALTAVNAPVKDIFEAIMEKTGVTVSLPDNIHGRMTWSRKGMSPKWCLKALADLNELKLQSDDDGTPTEVVSSYRTRELYAMSDEERIAAYRTEVNPTNPTTGILTGYLLYRGHYVPPPYEIAKVRIRAFEWEIRVNGLTCDRLFTGAPKNWVPELPPDGQLGRLSRIEMYSANLWCQGESLGKTVEEIKVDIEAFLRQQKLLREFEWRGERVVRIVRASDGAWNDALLKDIPYPPGEQLSHRKEILSCMFALVDQIRDEGSVKSYAEAEPIIIKALLGQEMVAGPQQLKADQRLQKAHDYYQNELRSSLVHRWARPSLPEVTEADVKERAEKKRLRVVRALESHGLVSVLVLGGIVCVNGYEGTYDTLQSAIAVAESDLPVDVKICAARALFGSHDCAWLIVSNFRPTVEMKQRVGADIERLKNVRELRNAVRPLM